MSATPESDPLSSPQNPLEGLPGVEPEWVAAAPPAPPVKPKVEDPPWSGWDVLLIIGVTLAATFLLSIVAVVGAKLLILRSVPWIEITKIPEVLVFAQLLAYIAISVSYTHLTLPTKRIV